MNTQPLTEPVCIVDGHHGVYVPQIWAQRYGDSAVQSAGVLIADISVLIKGPDSDLYWEAWDNVLNNYCHEVSGVKHYIQQDGDLFEYPETFQWEEY